MKTLVKVMVLAAMLISSNVFANQAALTGGCTDQKGYSGMIGNNSTNYYAQKQRGVSERSSQPTASRPVSF